MFLFTCLVFRVNQGLFLFGLNLFLFGLFLPCCVQSLVVFLWIRAETSVSVDLL